MLPIYLMGLLGALAIYGVYEWGREDGQNETVDAVTGDPDEPTPPET